MRDRDDASGTKLKQRSDIAMGAVPLHIWLIQLNIAPTAWERKLGVIDKGLGESIVSLDVDNLRPSGQIYLPISVLSMLMASFSLLGLWAGRHPVSGRRRLIPRSLFVSYLAMVVLMLLLSIVDRPSAGPMGGTVTTLAQTVLAFPWAVFLAQPNVVVPGDSFLLLFLIAGNAIFLFVFSSNGRSFGTSEKAAAGDR